MDRYAQTEREAGDAVAAGGGRVMDWYAVSVAVGFEQVAKKAIEERVLQQNLIFSFGEILLPTEKVMDIKKGGRQVESERKLYPGYLFIEIERDSGGKVAPRSECWHLVRRSPRVKGFISGTSDNPVPLSREEVDKIRRMVQDGEGKKPVLRSLYTVGDQIRIKEGPFAEFSGTVENVNTERSRLTVLVMVFGRSTPVELGFEQVDKM